jgi:hypothetical protein
MSRATLSRLLSSYALGGVVVLSLVMLAGVLQPSRASAESGFTVLPPMHYGTFSLPAAKGFRVSVFTYAHRVTLEAEQIRGAASVLYKTEASSRKGKIVARFGRLGVMHMRWEPTTPYESSREPQGDCHGKRALVQRGVFVGHFVFRGEGGFTESRTKRVPGLKVRSFRTVCHGIDAGPESAQRPEESLLAVSRSGGKVLRFRASARATESGPIEEFEANAAEQVGKLSVERFVLAGGAAVAGEFTFDSEAGTARVEPPVPFMGSGSLNEPAGEGWTGDLSVDLLGLGRTSLTEGDFKARLVSRDGGIQPPEI